MLFRTVLLTVFSMYVLSTAEQRDSWESRVIPGYMVFQGVAIAGLWVPKFLDGTFKDGFFKAQEGDNLFWPHVTAEYLTAAGLITSGVGIMTEKEWGKDLAMISLGALAYTSINSTSWTFAKKERYIYAIPMLVGLTGAGISIGVLY